MGCPGRLAPAGGTTGSDTVVNIGSDTSSADGKTVATPTVAFANVVTVVGMPLAELSAPLLGLGHGRVAAPAILPAVSGAPRR
jgi:hypothetical protein